MLWEWWLQIWPNLAASGVTFGSGLLWARRRFLLEMERREIEHLKRHRETQDALAELRSVPRREEG